MGACTRIGTPEGWSGAVLSGETLFIGTLEGELRALDASTGEPMWRFRLGPEQDGAAIYGMPALVDQTIYVGGYDGRLYAFNLEGEVVWSEIVGEAEPIVGGPVLTGDTLLVGSSDGRLYAFDAAEGTKLWSFPTGNKVWSAPAVANGVAYFGSLDHSLYAVEVEKGTQVWHFPAEGAITATPVVADGRVYFGAFDSVFYAVDADSGNEVWRFDGASSWFWGGAILASDTILAPSLDGNLYALDASSGNLLWTLKTDEPIVGSPAIVDGRVAVASMDGRVRVVRLSDGLGEERCDIGVRIRAPLTANDGTVYLSAGDHSVRALTIKTDGNPDEEWVHFTDREDPVPQDHVPAC